MRLFNTNNRTISKWHYAFIGIIVIAVTAGVVAWLVTPKNNAEFTNVLGAVDTDVAIYYPAKMPDGYALNATTVTKTETLLSYAISNGDDKDYFFSMQKTPRQSIVTNFESVQLTGAAPVDTAIGSAVIGVANGQTMASVVTDSSWIIITAPQGGKKSDLMYLVENLQALN